MRLASVAVFSEGDRSARHVRMADQACPIGPSPPAESYLRIDRILAAARASGADAVHPGYGFLSENADFAAACRDAGLIFVGPSPEAIALMGSKTAARAVAEKAGVPVVPGSSQPLPADASDEAIERMAAAVGYPIMVKAVAGGGGKGMRMVGGPADLPGAIRAARSEAGAAFGNPAVYLERALDRPRHVEVQLLADHHGTVLPFVERECSIQRRHQKVIEESPSPVVSPLLRTQLTDAAVGIARAAAYTNAGTIEFLLDKGGRFYFLEMNTRLQVEHPITEAVTGVDLVQWQLRIASGERLTLDPQALLTPRGHAIECRIYAEDAAAGFMPSPGRIRALRVPGGPGIRDDGGAEAGEEVPIYYDPLISKLIAWGEDRPQAVARMRRALEEYDVRGIETTVPFFNWLLAQPAFAEAAFDTGFLDASLQRRPPGAFLPRDLSLEEVAAVAGALAVTLRRNAQSFPQLATAADDAFRRDEPPAPGPVGAAGSAWARQARRDALR